MQRYPTKVTFYLDALRREGAQSQGVAILVSKATESLTFFSVLSMAKKVFTHLFHHSAG
ncbi:MAG: hypothetical protein CNIPEHKO_03040 [Anaerolineales bacterium]|nr:hypothetical protein [Anaerolineales bacterium]